MKKELIIFDFADTIAYLSPSKEQIVHQFISDETGLDIELNTINEAYHYINNTLFYSSVKVHNNQDKKEFYAHYNQILFNLLGLSHKVDTDRFYEYIKNNKQHWHLKEGVKELFQELKNENFLISLVSNFDTRLEEILKDMDIYNLFDSVFISQAVGFEKPSLDFFNLPLDKHNVSSQNAYFIGDSYHLDFYPSTKLGMHPILLDEEQRYPHVKYPNKVTNILDCIEIVKQPQ